jgi:outer membrane protein OmpA-like peptidoglycan-associated protein
MRNLLTLALLALLAACQTVPAVPRFSAAQVAVLQQEGFKPGTAEAWELGIEDRVLFAVNESALQPESIAIIDRLAKTLAGIGLGGAMIEGHTDSSGSSEYNQALSLRRAEAVKVAMVAAGMPEAGVRVIGLGETDPIETNDTPEGRAQNRRVVVIVAPSDLIGR